MVDGVLDRSWEECGNGIVTEPIKLVKLKQDIVFPDNIIALNNVIIEDCVGDIDMSNNLFVKGECVIRNCKGKIKLPKHFVVEGNFVVDVKEVEFECVECNKCVFSKNVFISGGGIENMNGKMIATKSICGTS